MIANTQSHVGLASAGQSLRVAALNVMELLQLAGYSGSAGDTTDDLMQAIVRYDAAMQEFIVTVRTEEQIANFRTEATSSFGAYASAAQRCGDTPFAISIIAAQKAAMTAEPDRVALERAHRTLRVSMPLDGAMKDKSLAVILRRIARKHMTAPPGVDIKKLAANDHD